MTTGDCVSRPQGTSPSQHHSFKTEGDSHFTYTYRQTQRDRQNEETEDCVPDQRMWQTSRKKDLNEMETRNLPDIVKLMVITMVTRLGTRMDGHSKTFNKERENLRKYQTEVIEQMNTITELKNIP